MSGIILKRSFTPSKVIRNIFSDDVYGYWNPGITKLNKTFMEEFSFNKVYFCLGVMLVFTSIL